MDRERLVQLLNDLRDGKSSVDDACRRLAQLPFEDLSFAKIDHHRPLRTGMPEVIFAEGKTVDQVAAIFERMAASETPVLVTRADSVIHAAIAQKFPHAEYHDLARCITLPGPTPTPSTEGHIVVVCAGTSDLPVAEEAAVTAEFFASRVTRIVDVGVAGIQRLLAHVPLLQQADVVIACAGMEGALPSAVGGFVSAPVIAVPTSVGYGAAFGGIAALLGMLNSCAPNTTVVNIDNGFGAAYAATLIVRAIRDRKRS